MQKAKTDQFLNSLKKKANKGVGDLLAWLDRKEKEVNAQKEEERKEKILAMEFKESQINIMNSNHKGKSSEGYSDMQLDGRYSDPDNVVDKNESGLWHTEINRESISDGDENTGRMYMNNSAVGVNHYGQFSTNRKDVDDYSDEEF